MNRFKVIVIVIAVITLSLFSVAFYSSCKKDACVGVTCFNNAPCNNGSCTCPPGFSGVSCASRAITNIEYLNNSLSEVTVSVNASSSSGSNEIGPGQTFVVTGNYGTSVIGTASTSYYTYSSGQSISWNLNDTFPPSGVTIVPLNVPSSYFFLYIINNNPTYYVSQAVINYDQSTQATVTGLDIYSSSSGAYPVGYFRSSSTPNVLLSTYTTPDPWPIINFTLPDTVNQSYTAIVN